MIIFTFTLYLSLIMLAVIALFYGFTMKLADEYDASNKGWDPIPLVQILKASKYKIFNNVIAIVFSAK